MAEKRRVSRSIYDSISGVIQNKGKWHTAASKGEDASSYAEAAKPSYKFLRDSGYGDMADSLEKMDYTQALAYLDAFEVDAPTDYAEQYQQMYGSAKSKSDQTFNAIMNDKAGLGKDYDDYMSFVKEGYTGKDYAETLRKQYEAMGNEAVLGELAATGAENAGNIDSYAKAQAQRQQLAYANAGENAALNQYNAIVGNYLNGIDSKAGMTADAWQKLIDVTGNEQALAAGMYSDLTAADASVRAAEQEALAAQYEAETAANNNIKDMAKEFTQYWAENQKDPPTASQISAYYQAIINSLQGEKFERPYTPASYFIEADENYDSDYIASEWSKKGVLDQIEGIAKEQRLTPQQRVDEVLKYIGEVDVSKVLGAMDDEYRNAVNKILDDLYALLPEGSNVKREDVFAPTTNTIK